ncbi:MAG: hypothetical protein M1839_000450 [Geoglossum umbratile]|nr:MAG: hypothetical protein M1839_000450 [Geoglossum umbratile]
MELGDLPIETLDRIIWYSIDEDWAYPYQRKVLAMRTVCRKFNGPVSQHALEKAWNNGTPIKFDLSHATAVTIVWHLRVKAMLHPHCGIDLITAMNVAADLMDTLTVGDPQISRYSKERAMFLYTAAKAAEFYQGRSLVCQFRSSEKVARSSARDYRNALAVAAFSGDERVVRFLLAKGVNVNACDHFGPALCAAAAGNRLAIARLLLDAGADVDIVGRKEYSALSEAAERGHITMMQLLLDRGCNVEIARADSGFLPLQRAILKGHGEAVELLVKNKVDVNRRVWDWKPPIHLAVVFNQVSSVRILLAHPDFHLAGDYYGLLFSKAAERGYEEPFGEDSHLATSSRAPTTLALRFASVIID